jgi:Helix-turn-helix domain
MTTIESTEYMTTPDVAQAIGIAAQTLRAWRSDRRPHIPYIKAGNTVLYAKADVDAWIRLHGKYQSA